ncbi:hypothetical protein [Ramlibacter sp.]|uniref:hypothetical protein n=1 Tax=Ramlibacter sp. TaxID=1917967 RepID=UPI0017DD9222|nr:hypothetical protein [Ramlibacter sp.]MBA2672399.1 hypothetical protein [Ramlibacter sp.]
MSIDYASLRTAVETKMGGMLRTMYEKLPIGRYFRDSSDISRQLFIRHTIQTILRIRLARVADAKTLVLLTKTNPRAAQLWARYADEEMLHDRLFLQDIQRMGMTEEAVYATRPFLATQLLQGYIYYTLEHEGPLGLLAKAYFLEFVSYHTQREWNVNLERALGSGAIEGAKAHIAVDEGEDHIGDVWNVVAMEVHDEADAQRLQRYIDTYYQLFTAYLQELASSDGQLDLGTITAPKAGDQAADPATVHTPAEARQPAELQAAA